MATKTDAQKESELRAVGWTPSAGDSVQAAYARTATQADGGNAPNPTTGAAPAAAPNQDLAGYVAAMQASSGLSIKDLNEKIREFDATLKQQQDMWRQQGLPQLAIQQRTADLENAKFAELQRAAIFSENLQTAQQALANRIQTGQLTNATAAQELQNRIQSGQLAVQQDQQALARQIQTGQLAVSQGQLGLDTLKTAASLSGPADWLKSAAFTRGVQQQGTLPAFVGQLLNGQSTAVLPGQTPGVVMPAANTLQSMAANMGAGPGVAATPTAVTQPAVPLANPSADAAARAAAYTSQAASPTAAPSGFFTQIANNQQVYTPPPAGPTATAGMDPTHMGAFYASALRTANDGTQTPGVTPDPSAAAMPSDVSKAFSLSNPNAGAPAADTSGVDAMRKLYAAGGQALAPQQLEGLTGTESKMLTGGIDTAGGDSTSYLDQYARSRVGQKAAMPGVVGQ